MWGQMRKPIRRVAVRGMIALVAASLFAATASQHVLPLTKQRSYNVMQVAQIDEAPSTIGVADSELYLAGSLEEINARLDLMQSLGVTNVRIMVPWAGVYPAPPEWNHEPQWGQLDLVVNAAAARGMGILGVLNSTPIWATSNTPVNGMPKDVNQFAAFAKEVALRYGDKISAYEVWNEPNAQLYFNPVSPEKYTELLKVTYTALKEASALIGADITVIGGVVGAGLTFGDFTMNPIDFVRRMYAAGADGFFDALSFHPYNADWKFSGADLPDWAQGQPWTRDLPLAQLNAIRALMDSFLEEGEERVKIWISEYGVATNQVSEAKQAAFVRDLIEFWQTVEGAGPIFIYTILDRLDPNGQDWEAHLGLFRPDGTIKPAGQVVKELIEYLATNPEWPIPGPGPGSPNNPVEALLQALQSVVSHVLNFIPSLIAAVGTFVTNLVGSLLGGGMQAATSGVALRTAALDAGDKPADAASKEADALDGDVETADGKAEDTTADKVTEETTEEAATEEEVPAEEVTEEDVPAEEVPAEEVTEETPADEVTEETPADEAATEPVAETVETVTDGSETTGTVSPKDTGTAVTGERDLEAAASTDTVSPEVRQAAVPNLKARQTLGTRAPQGTRHAVRANSESGQGGSAPTRERATSGSPSGGGR